MRSQKEVQSREKIQTLTNALKHDPYNQNQAKVYKQRSEQYQILNENKSAIVDLSKSLYINPTCDGYYKRGKLYASSQMFYEALMDFQEAQKIYYEEKMQTIEKPMDLKAKGQTKIEERATMKPNKNVSPETEIFLEKATVVLKLPEIKKIVKKHDKSKQFLPEQFNSQFNNLMNKLIEAKIGNELKALKEQNNAYIELLALVKKQDDKIRQLQKNMQSRSVDYQTIFTNQINESTLSEQNKQKCSIYFFTVVSEMEKFYLSAKVLSEFQEKISFEDYETKYKLKMQEKKIKSQGIYVKVIQKVFKLFQKHEDKLQRLGQIIKQIPYIGTAFKLIKPTLKICGALEEMKLESQCQNILNTRPSVSSFNKLSSRVAYELYKYFKISITTQSIQKSSIYKKNYFQRLSSEIHHFKRNQMAAKVFPHVKPQQKDFAVQMGSTHASILMVGIAYGAFTFPSQNGFEQGDWQRQTFQKISQMQQKMLNTQYIDEGVNQGKQKSDHKDANKGCSMF